jgi:hypothetical protein
MINKFIKIAKVDITSFQGIILAVILTSVLQFDQCVDLVQFQTMTFLPMVYL